jgi:hypothetical protein
MPGYGVGDTQRRRDVSWPEAATAIGIAWAFAFVVWVIFRHGFDIQFRDPSAGSTTPIEDD